MTDAERLRVGVEKALSASDHLDAPRTIKGRAAEHKLREILTELLAPPRAPLPPLTPPAGYGDREPGHSLNPRLK